MPTAGGRRPEPYGGGHMAAGNWTTIRDVAIKETYQLNADVCIYFADATVLCKAGSLKQDRPVALAGNCLSDRSLDAIMMPNTEAARSAAGWLAKHSKARVAMIMASADHYVRDSAEPGPMPECIARSRDLNTDMLLHGLPTDWDISIAVPGRAQVVGFDNTRESRYSSPPAHHRRFFYSEVCADGCRAADSTY